MKRSLSIFVLTVFVICFVGVADISAANAADEKPVADVVLGSSGLSLVPKVNYHRLVLTVSTPEGTVIRKAFETGSSPYFGLSDLDGISQLDGSYTFELQAIPFPRQMARQEFERAGGLIPAKKSMIQTGAFMIQGGSIVTPGPGEDISRPQDVLHYDDVIITGSLCVGFDCQDGESFGFDTIILKEHNLRIYFNDTSYTASYPTNNWRITINDSTNGGASYFSVDDVDDGTSIFKIEAGAPSNSLYVEDYGRVGLGTSTPVVELHIKDSDTPTLRLEQDSSGGWTAQTWDVAGNESNFFVRDATNGSKLPFRIQPSTPSSTLCLKSDGYVGIGTWSPAYPLELETTGINAEFLMERTSGAQAQMGAAASLAYFGARTDHEVRFQVNSDWRMRLNPTSNSTILEMTDGGYYDGTWHGSSSREIKENIQGLTVDEAMAALEGLNPVKFHYKTNKEDEHVGFIAEDVPDLVAAQNRKALSAMDVVAVLTKVVKEQQKMMQEQQKNISQLKKEIDALKKKQ
jgi:hypothetical protein